MKQFSSIVLFLIFTGFSFQSWGQVIANDDNIKTGPSQKIKYDVTVNDEIPCSNYSLNIVSISPSSAGSAVFEGDYLTFTPASGIINQDVDIVYNLECPGEDSDQATVTVTITPYNLPINMIQTGEECIDAMPENVDFGIHQKFTAYSDENRSSSLSGGYLQPFHMPLVGDLNGDGKPEILSPGMTDGGTLTNAIRYLYVFDGQNGKKTFKFDLTTLGTGYGNTTSTQTGGGFRLGIGPYHQSPSYFAIADVDNDGIVEIIVTQTCFDGKVYCLKPVLGANKEITDFIKVWDGEVGHKAPLSPTGSTTFQTFGQPIPNIVDINGDGIPELVIYNKIYNAQTGKLLMAWNGAASTNTSSSLATNTGLYDYNPGSVPSNQTYSDNIKSRAMVGRRPAGSSDLNDAYLAVPAIVDIDEDGTMEVITGNRIHKFSLTYLGQDGELGDHTQNTYTTVEGPSSVVLPTGTSTSRTVYLNDGFTRVADIDGDGKLDIIVTANMTATYPNVNILVYVYDPVTGALKAASSLWSSGTYGQFGIPFIGDINDRLDGRDDSGVFTKKVPEILFCAGKIYCNRTTANDGGRSGMQYHPESTGLSGTSPTGTYHTVGITYDGGESDIVDRLKISWVLANQDQSNNTGITMFDFDNDGAFDLCYRDEEYIRVISPKLGTSDLIPVTATPDNNPAILFRQACNSETGFEAPVIADINLDGSADIIVTGWVNAELYWANVYVFEYAPGNPMWAPCPPVWNQALYNPLHINEDLTVPAKPISMLTKFPLNDTGDTIQPYNGAWIQQPIVQEGENYVPVYRHPDAVLTNMNVEVSGGNTKITIIVRNDGLASINANTPVYFYHTVPGSSTRTDETVIPIGVDIFPNEKVELEYTISNTPSGMFTHCRLVDDGTNYPATGYTDCRTDNNYGYTSVIRAIDDYFTAYKGQENIYDIIMNDTIIGNPILEIIEGPNQGIATITADGQFSYTPNANASYNDTVKYLLKCEYGGDTLATADTAYIFIRINTLPDNIDNADCYIIPSGTTWSIKETTLNNSVLIHNYGPLVVGDIDDDGIVEIIGYKENTVNTNNYESPGLKIFYYNEVTNRIELKSEFLFSSSGGATSATFGAMAMARYNDETYIVVAGTDKYLYAYNINGGRIWISDTQYKANGAGTILGIADFNNDGTPEVYTGNQIFSLSNGFLLCDGGTSNSSGVLTVGNSTVAVDMDGDGILEIVAGINIYKVSITNNLGTSGNSIDLLPGMQLTASLPTNAINDGATQVVDIDNDGILEVVVMSLSGGRVVAYVWKPLPNNQSYIMGSYLVPATGAGYYSIPMLGNIDDTIYPEIVFITNGSLFYMYALKFDPMAAVGNQISLKWSTTHTDGSGCTGATLFDFNQDRINEIVYRDQTQLRIFDGDGQVLPGATFNDVRSATLREFPIIADIDGDGQAEIIVTGWDGVANTVGSIPASTQNGYLRMFKTNGSPWAPARKVWNQYAYNAVNVNEDLTIPQYQLNPATLFPGDDGVFGTPYDTRPYNGFLMQQTTLSKNGTPIWITPDAVPDQSLSSSSSSGNSVNITIGIINQGDAAIGSPVYVTLYKESISAGNIIQTGSANIQIHPGDTGYVTVSVPDITPYLPVMNIIARINDDGTTFPYQEECDTDGSELTFLNPAIGLMMKKNATLNGTMDNGNLANPVSVLFGEDIEYKITAVNANLNTGGILIKDTLPAYLNFVSGSESATANFSINSFGSPARDVVTWSFTGVSSMADTTVTFKATPQEGACASQPLFINKAWITVSDTIHVVTGNSTFHQGAGIGVSTFSAGFGGQIFNAEPQALDYQTSAKAGILIAPDEGYKFSGWSHEDYISLRGYTIKAQSGIMLYDTLIIYGNVELTANFKPETYVVDYYLNGGENADHNPVVYSIESGNIRLDPPRKSGDTFIGWTGSNGQNPQPDVTIFNGSTGNLEFYANFLHSGSEVPNNAAEADPDNKEKIWAVNDLLFIRTLTGDNTVRIYTANGILQEQHTITSDGVSEFKLQRGLYIVTLNNGIGQKVWIE